MSETKITVSDGTNFYLIPLSDVEEACADGFYIPSHHGRTIVSDGTEIFEIPLEDLADARADGFYDILAAELEIANSVRMQSERESDDGEAAEDTGFEPEEIPEVPALKSQDETATEEPVTFAARIHRLLHPDAVERRRLLVLVTNAAVHGGILLILAAVFLPAMQKEEILTITSNFEPEFAETEELQMMEVEQAVEIADSTPPSEVIVDSLVESMDVIDVDINDLDLSSMVTNVDLNSNTPSAKSSSEFGGRSKAGRSAMVAKMGGSAASEKAVQQGLQWLEKHQEADGGWSFDHTGGECKGACSQPGTLKNECRSAATGLAILAMLGAGNTPFEGDFQESVVKGIQFLLAHSAASPAGLDLRGSHAHNTGMYCQAIAATALCETLAMLQHEVKEFRGQEDQRPNNRNRLAMIRKLEPAALAGINFIINAQHRENGSWGYEPGASGDTSILGWQVMALKSAVHAKIPINSNAVRGANLFLNQVQGQDGRYGYTSVDNLKSSTTAIGLVCRMLSGMSREEPHLQAGIALLSQQGPSKNEMYYNYYATQAMLHFGGDEWKKWNSVMREQLISTQQTEGHAAGSWNIADTHGGAAGRLYMTCLCTMTLEVYYRHLPLYGVPADAESDSDQAEGKTDKTSGKKVSKTE